MSAHDKAPRPPSDRTETVREALRRVLFEGAANAKDLSGMIGIREKDVPEHLEHLQKSLAREGLQLRVTPSSCISCGFVFKDRKRLTRPGSCPECRGTRIDPPLFQITEEA